MEGRKTDKGRIEGRKVKGGRKEPSGTDITSFAPLYGRKEGRKEGRNQKKKERKGRKK